MVPKGLFAVTLGLFALSVSGCNKRQSKPLPKAQERSGASGDAGPPPPTPVVQGPTRIAAAFFSHTGEGPRLIAVAGAYDKTIHREQFRFEVIDVEHGKRAGQLVLPPAANEPACSTALGGRLWCQDGKNGVHVRDMATLAVIADQAALTAKTALLAKGIFRNEPPKVEVETRALLLVSNDGVRLALDPRTLEAKPVLDSVEGMPMGSGHNPTSNRLVLRDQRYYLDSQTRRRGLLLDRAEVGGMTFLRAGFLVDRQTGGVHVLDSPDSVLVMHADTLDERAAKTMISRVTPAGEELWTHQAGVANLRGAWLSGQTLVVAWAEPGVAVGIDVATGKERWRLTL